MDHARLELEKLAVAIDPALKDLRAEAIAFPAVRAELEEARAEIGALRTLANQFHAEADHNGRHLEAARDQVAHISHQLTLARAEAATAHHEAAQLLPVRREIALLEATVVRQTARNKALDEALEKERRLATAHLAHSQQAYAQFEGEIARLSALLGQAAQEVEAANAAVAGRQSADDELAHRVEALSEALQSAQDRAAAAVARSEILEGENRLLASANDRMSTSRAWRWSRPFRVAAKRLRILAAGKNSA